MRCAVFNCNSDNQAKACNKSIRFYTFPKDDMYLRVWVDSCCRSDNFNTKTARICSKHFQEGDFERNLKYELLKYMPPKGLKLRKEAVPSLLLPKCKRQDRLKIQNVHKEVDEIIKEKSNQELFSDVINENGNNENEFMESSFKNTNTIGVNTDNEYILNMEKELNSLREEKKVFQKLFSDRQINKLKNPSKRFNWSAQEISEGMVQYSAGPRAYRLLLKKGYPFPAISTLKSWRKKIN